VAAWALVARPGIWASEKGWYNKLAIQEVERNPVRDYWMGLMRKTKFKWDYYPDGRKKPQPDIVKSLREIFGFRPKRKPKSLLRRLFGG
jgi:hypothetical protein